MKKVILHCKEESIKKGKNASYAIEYEILMQIYMELLIGKHSIKGVHSQLISPLIHNIFLNDQYITYWLRREIEEISRKAFTVKLCWGDIEKVEIKWEVRNFDVHVT